MTTPTDPRDADYAAYTADYDADATYTAAYATLVDARAAYEAAWAAYEADYDARDPRLLGWVHVTEVDSFLAAKEQA